MISFYVRCCWQRSFVGNVGVSLTICWLAILMATNQNCNHIIWLFYEQHHCLVRSLQWCHQQHVLVKQRGTSKVKLQMIMHQCPVEHANQTWVVEEKHRTVDLIKPTHLTAPHVGLGFHSVCWYSRPKAPTALSWKQAHTLTQACGWKTWTTEWENNPSILAAAC